MFSITGALVLASFITLLTAIAAGLITRSVMVSNHRQAWINGLRDDLAAFFTAVDVMHFQIAKLATNSNIDELEKEQKARNDVLLAYRKILMRLNLNEPAHQQLEKSLEALLTVHDNVVNQDALADAVTLARTILKREWEVTKYGAFTPVVARIKTRWLKSRPRGQI